MYYCSSGTRTLVGAEAVLFRESLEVAARWIVDHSDDDAGLDWGIEAFDRLTLEQKIFLLVQVGEALLVEAAPAPDLTACVEAAVATVFEACETEVNEEVNDPEMKQDPLKFRRLILAAMEGDLDEFPSLDSTDLGEWNFLIECLRDRILWDGDYEDEHLFIDHPTERSEDIHDFMGVDADYFTAIAHDPKGSELADLRRRLDDLRRPTWTD